MKNFIFPLALLFICVGTPRAFEKSELQPDLSKHSKQSFFQEYVWQITAISTAALTGLMVNMECQAYNDLADQNKELENMLAPSILTDEVLQIRTQYSKNKSAMRTHKKNVNNYTILALGALAWESYLLFFASNSDENTENIESRFRPNFNINFQPDFKHQSTRINISLAWNWYADR